MARQRGAVGAGVLLGLLVLAVVNRIEEAAAVKAIKERGGVVLEDPEGPGLYVQLIRDKFTDTELKQYVQDRAARDSSANGTRKTQFEDRQLQKALECLQAQLGNK